MKNTLNLGLLVSALLVAATACGDDDDARDQSPSVPSGATTAPTSTTPSPAPKAPPTTPPPSDPPPPAITSTQGKLLVGDGDPENPRMTVVDLDDGKVVAAFPTLGSPTTYRSSSGARYAYANQRVHGVVEIVDSGVLRSAEGGSLEKHAPSIVPQRFEGALPTHWVHHHDWIVSFNDGDGTFDYLLEPTLSGGRVLKYRATTTRKHHGVAVIANGNVFASLPDPNDEAASLPVGVTVRRLATPDTIVKTSTDCAGLHGEGSNDAAVAFGCVDGVLIASGRTATSSSGSYRTPRARRPTGASERSA